ncbi:MAG: hypothetical protein P1P84_02600 [Deferrisomatales bacterium]|nr:hypothetical protein [Deferrisomatales bacterium]
MVRYRCPAGGDAAAIMAARVDKLDAQLRTRDATEAAARAYVLSGGVWEAHGDASKQDVAALLLRHAMGLEDSLQAYRILNLVVPWVLSQGYTAAQIAAYFGVELEVVAAMNARWTYLSHPLRVAAMEDYATILAGDAAVEVL